MKFTKKLKKTFAIIITLALIMSSFSFSLAFANEKYEISIKDGIVTEYSVGNINGQTIEITRVTRPDGTTNVKTVSGIETYEKTGTINYQELIQRIKYEKETTTILKRADTAHGPNCYHVVIAENEITATKKEGAVSAAAMAAILATAFTANPRVILKVATVAYNAIMKKDIAYVEVSEQVNEVFFKADNVYYTHCYHNTIRSYDAFDHLVSTTTQRNQAVGG